MLYCICDCSLEVISGVYAFAWKCLWNRGKQAILSISEVATLLKFKLKFYPPKIPRFKGL